SKDEYLAGTPGIVCLVSGAPRAGGTSGGTGRLMRYALINPHWNFEGSIYFGCREPHLPLELGYSKALLEQRGHETLLIDGHSETHSNAEIAARASKFAPDFIVITTAPTYLFWRCPPPEIRVPQALV